MATQLSDEILIAQAISGKQQAFAMLVHRYEQYVFTLALRMVRNREDAHEVAQDCFLKAFRYLSDFRGESRFSTWIYRIVYNTSLNHLRKNNPDIQSIDDDLHPVQLPDEGTPDAGWGMEQEERNRSVRAAIALLSPDDAAIITLFYLQEQSLEEICVITSMSMSNAKTKLCRARQRLKGILVMNDE
jgi:RNA polymerase sigma factor (sigma-70 family)